MNSNLEFIKSYKIQKLDNFSAFASPLICIMEQTRRITIETVKNLNRFELDFLLDENANSIGALLAHIAAVEKWFQAVTFENKKIQGEELLSIEAALDLGEKARQEINGNDIEFYINQLNTAREKTIYELLKRNDEWFLLDHTFTENEKANNYYLWFHVIEDEISHRGQINFIKKRIKQI